MQQTIQHQYICSTLQYNSVPAYLQHSTEHLQHISGDLHITVQFSTSTLAVHYIKIQYQHICSTFQVTCTFAAHKDGDTRSYFIPLIGLFAVFRTITAQLQHICCTNTAHLQHQYISAQLQHNYSTFQHNYST